MSSAITLKSHATEGQRAFFEELKKLTDIDDIPGDWLNDMLKDEALSTAEQAVQNAQEQAHILKVEYRGEFVNQYDEADYRFS